MAYDRAGLGHSAWGAETPTARHATRRLRALLERVGAAPPYVLVGYSWGGILARYFAGYYPAEIAGLVLVDPAPIVTQSLADNLAPFEAIGAGRAGYDAYWSSFARLFANASPAVRAEFEEFRSLMERAPADRDVRPLPDVPLVVIVAARYLPLTGLTFPLDPLAHFQADVRHRIDKLREWTLGVQHGTLVVSSSTTHAVPREDPDLVAWAVGRVLSAGPRSRQP